MDLSAGFAITSVTVGLEFIWFKDKYHRGKSYAPYIYAYSSIALGASSNSRSSLYTKVKNFLKSKMKNFLRKSPTKVSGIRSVFSFSVSFSVFAIFGYTSTKGKYKKFTSASSYKGPFAAVSASLFGIKGYIALGESCFALGVGVDSSKFSAYYSNSYYILLNKSESDLKSFFRSVRKKVGL